MTLTRSQFEALALAEVDALYRLARRLTRDGTRADDLVQETFARALKSWTKFEPQAFGIKPWLLRILYNLHLNRAERERRQPVALADDAMAAVPDDGHGGLDVPADLPIDPADFQAMDQELVRAIEGLPTESRVVLLLWAVEELSYKEIAAAVGVPIGTVMSRLHRARQRLAAELRPYAESQGIVRG